MAPQFLELMCPWCGRNNNCIDLAAGEDARPDAGSVSVCIGCARPSVFLGSRGPLRLPESAEMLAMFAENEVPTAMMALVVWKAAAGDKGDK